MREDSLSNPTHTPLNLSRQHHRPRPTRQRPRSARSRTPRSSCSTRRRDRTRASSRLAGAFEIAVPCGVYAVTASVGDSGLVVVQEQARRSCPSTASTSRARPLIDDFTPTDKTKFKSATQDRPRLRRPADDRRDRRHQHQAQLRGRAPRGHEDRLPALRGPRRPTRLRRGRRRSPTATPAATAGCARTASRAPPTCRSTSGPNTADRDPYDVDQFAQKHDTTIFMQYPTTGSNPRLVEDARCLRGRRCPATTTRSRSASVTPPASSLKSKPGDVSTHRINVEGVNAIAGFVPTDNNKFATATRTVNVCDGRLTIDAIGGTNTKLNYIDVERLP